MSNVPAGRIEITRAFRLITFLTLICSGLFFHAATIAATVDDDLAPLAIPIPPDPEDSDTSDPSQLTGYQIRPPSASLKVNRSLALIVRNCFENVEESATYIECNPRATTSLPLRPPFAVSNWSVNGIRGGNAVIGRISAQGNKAIYTAPATVPDPATVAVSVEVPPTEGDQSLAVANITIIEGVIYSGTVKFSGRREEQGETIEYAGTAELEYRHADSFNGGVRYDLHSDNPQTKLVFEKWSSKNDSVSCSLKRPVIRWGSSAPFTPPANLFIYSSLQSYVFGALLEAAGIVTCIDGNEIYEEEVDLKVLLTTSSGNLDPGQQPLEDIQYLSGTSTMNLQLDEDAEDSVTQTNQWSFHRQE